MTRIEKLLECWLVPDADAQVKPLGAHGGLSGAEFWRVAHAGRQLCLRRWPKEHPDRTHLENIHGLLGHLAAACGKTVPAPLRLSTGQTIVASEGHLWELAPWLPGTADYHQDPQSEKLTAALQALARLHHAASFYRTGDKLSCESASSALQHRLQRLRALQQSELQTLRNAVDAHPQGPLRQVALDSVQLMGESLARVEKQLAAVADTQLPLQWTLQDVRHDHILFEGVRVSGIVDFGAAGVGSATVDIARLLGSLLGDDAARWRFALQAYQQTRPLSADEQRAVGPLDSSGTMLAAANWLQWLFLDQRNFPDYTAVYQRLQSLCERLRNLARRQGASILD